MTVVAVSTTRLRRAISAAPSAAVSCGCGRGHDGCAQVLGEPLGDQRNAGAAADGGYRRDACRGHAVALESFVKRRKEFRERRLHQVLEFGARDADIGAVAGKIGRDGRRGLRRQPFLGAPAFVAQPHQ